MKHILALDCSTEACSVALLSTDSGNAAGATLVEEYRLAAREHTKALLPMVEQVLAAGGIALSGVDAVAYGRGPGSFTGLRVALGAVQGLAYGAELVAIPVSTLAALAQTWLDRECQAVAAPATLVAAIDARMDEVYWASYAVEDGLVIDGGEEQLTAPEQLQIGDTADVVGVGSGWAYRGRIPAAPGLRLVDADCLPRASAVARLACRALFQGDTQAPEQALPRYLRDQVAWQKQPQG